MASEELKQSILNMTRQEKRKASERLNEILTIPISLEPNTVFRLPILVQAVIWEGIWRIAPWATYKARRNTYFQLWRHSDYSYPLLDPEVISRELLFQGSEEFPDASAIIQSAIKFEDRPNWLDTVTIDTALERLNRNSEERSSDSTIEDLEYLSRVLLVGNPNLTLKIVNQAAQFSTFKARDNQEANFYFDDDLRKLICFSLARVSRTSDARRLAKRVLFIYNNAYRQKLSGIGVSKSMFPTFLLAILLLPNWRHRANALFYVMTKRRRLL